MNPTAPAPYGGDKSVSVVYGPSGIGKTTDLLYGFPNGLFLAPPGALKPAHHVVGFVPASAEAATIEDATKRLKDIAKAGKFDAVIVDDFSLLAESTLAHFENVKRLTGFKLWGAVRDAVLEFRDTARRVGMHVQRLVRPRRAEAPRQAAGRSADRVRHRSSGRTRLDAQGLARLLPLHRGRPQLGHQGQARRHARQGADEPRGDPPHGGLQHRPRSRP
jgi:hypothetical protein